MTAETPLISVAVVVSLLGLAVAYFFFLKRRQRTDRLAAASVSVQIHRLWFSGWGFDRLYHVLFVAPVVWISEVNKGDIVDQIYHFTAWLNRFVHQLLRTTQSGQVRWYAAGIGLGTVVVVAVVIFG